MGQFAKGATISSLLMSIKGPLKNNSYKIKPIDRTIKELAIVEKGANIFRFFIKQNRIIGSNINVIII